MEQGLSSLLISHIQLHERTSDNTIHSHNYIHVQCSYYYTIMLLYNVHVRTLLVKRQMEYLPGWKMVVTFVMSSL